ncbi:MAG: uroporphyrinogen-III C-methyltransferase [Gammaproteobacteria bacterium]|nr:uroporphyrinogen-III C-methyltransferase [Gammaproteobacteria bacterium]
MKKQTLGLVFIVVFGLLMVGFAGVGFYLYRQNCLLRKTYTLNQAELTALHDELAKVNKNDYWNILQAKSYIGLANATLLANNDIKAAKKLLVLAQDNLHSEKNSEIKDAIKQKIAELSSKNTINQSQLIADLNVIEQSIINLRELPGHVIKKPTNKVKGSNDEVTKSFWQKITKNSLDVMRNMVILQKSDVDMQPLFSSKYQLYLKEKMLLVVEEMRLAVLTYNKVVFKDACARLSKLIKAYAMHNITDKQMLLTKLGQIKSTFDNGESVSLENLNLMFASE